MLPDLDARLVQVVAVLIGIGVTFLVRDSVWAHEQVIGGQALDQLNTASTILVGALVGLGSNVLHVGVKAVRNIGENEGP